MEKGPGMIYTEDIKVDSEGRLVECPVCKNSDFSDDAQYCRICGLSRKNECIPEDHSYPHFNPVNARYCEYCGAETTFFRLKILLPWNTVSRKAESGGFIQVDEEDLPF